MKSLFTKPNLPPPWNFCLSEMGEIDNFSYEIENHETSHLILFRQYKLCQG